MIRQLVDTFGKILPQSAPTVQTAVLFFSAIIVVLNQKPIQYIKKKNLFPSLQSIEESALRSLNYFVMMSVASLKIMGR